MNDQVTFRIVKETLATRCEVCHQADRFDPETGDCLRCRPVVETRVAARTEETLISRTALAPLGLGNLGLSDLFDLAVRVYRTNFLLLAGIAAGVEIPLAQLVIFLSDSGASPPLTFAEGFRPWAAGLILTSIGAGALIQAICNVLQGRRGSPWDAYVQLFRNGGVAYPITALLGRCYQIAGLLFCGFLVFFTHPTGAFVPEACLIEHRRYSDALGRSIEIGKERLVVLCLLECAAWIVELAPLVWLGLLGVSGPALWFCHALVRIPLVPFTQVFRTLLFLRISQASVESSESVEE